MKDSINEPDLTPGEDDLLAEPGAESIYDRRPSEQMWFYCGVLLSTPQFMLTGVAGEPQATVPKLSVGPTPTKTIADLVRCAVRPEGLDGELLRRDGRGHHSRPRGGLHPGELRDAQPQAAHAKDSPSMGSSAPRPNSERTFPNTPATWSTRGQGNARPWVNWGNSLRSGRAALNADGAF